MPVIDLLSVGSIDHFIEQNKLANSSHILLSPLPKPIDQKGHTCKLYALSMVMDWLYIKDGISEEDMPPPARKSDRKTKEKSLRKEAKEYGSKVGEIYNHNILLQLAKNHGYTDSCIYDCNSNNYQEVIKQELTSGNAPIIFFDVNTATGDPINAESLREHAAVVIGYYTNKQNELCFITTQWGKYYSFSANQLMTSAQQLAQIRTPETFYKINKVWRQQGDRLDQDHGVAHAIINNLYSKQVIAQQTNDATGSFKNKILVVKSPMQELLHRKRNLTLHKNPSEENHPKKTREVKIDANFMPLDVLINFLEIDIIRPTPFTDEKLKEFADHFAFNDEIIALTQHHYQTEVEETLDDDIYKQNPNRTRSITELTSNAIDSDSKNIFVLINDGEYRVKDNGIGMTPPIIFRKFIPPKATSKEDSQNMIGLFGVGFYTALVHLYDENDYVLVITKAADFPAYRIEYRKYAGKFYIRMTRDSNVVDCGTEIIVHSRDIKTDQYKNVLAENVKYHTKTPIYINGQLINDLNHSQVYQLSQSKIIINNTENAGVITIGGITIQKNTNETLLNPFLVVWDLPRSVALSEGRNQPRIDSAILRHEVRQLIDFGMQLTALEQRICYFNNIAPIVKNLQTYNSSQHKQDDVLLYLQLVIRNLVGTLPQIPNTPFFAPLCTQNVIALHPLLLENDWINKVGYQPQEWHSEKTCVYIVNMKPTAEGIGFLHDRDEEIIYLNKADFEEIIKNDDLWKLELLFEHPNGEITGHWISNNKLPSQKVELPSLPLLERETAADKHKIFYQKHGCLRHFGDEFIESLTSEQQSILYQAATLMQAYTHHPILDDYGCKLVEKPYISLNHYSYHGKKYYHVYSERHQSHILLDEYFQPCYQISDLILLQKIDELRENDYDNHAHEITLSENDLFIIKDRKTYKSYLYDGTSKKLLERSLNDGHVSRLSNDYFIVSESDNEGKNQSTIFTRNLAPIHIFTGQIKILSNSPLIIEITQKNNKYIYDVANNKTIFQHATSLNVCGEFFITIEKQNSFSIYNSAEKCLFKFENIIVPNAKFKEIHCKLINSLFYISIFYTDRTSELIIDPPHLADGEPLAISDPLKRISHDEIIGFPISAYISRENGCLYFNVINQPQPALRIEDYKVFENESENSAYYIRSNRLEEGDTKTIIKDKVFLLRYQKEAVTQLSLVTSQGQLISLPQNWVNESIIDMQVSHYKYYLIKFQSDYRAIINRDGKIIAQGKNIVHEYFDFFIVDKQFIINPEGNVIYHDNGIQSLEVKYKNELIIVYRDNRSNILMNYQGKVITEFKGFSSDREGALSVKIDNIDYIITPHAVIPNALVTSRGRTIFQEHSDDSRTIFNTYGYTVFPHKLQSYSMLLAPNIVSNFSYESEQNCILQALTETDLRSEIVYNNLTFLNKFNLKPIEFGKCLRFIRLDSRVFQFLYPFMQKLKYVPTLEQIEQYIFLLKKIECEPEQYKDIIMDVLDLVYTIAGRYSTQNLAHKLAGILEIYGIFALKKLYESLLAKQGALQSNMHGIEAERDIINEMPQDVGQFIYYIFFPSTNILTHRQEIIPQSTPLATPLYLLDLFTAIRLNKNTVTLANNKEAFLQYIQKLTHNCHKHYLQRKLIHAIYHQAHPEKSLYMREFLQNAVDAYADSNAKGPHKIPLHIFKNEMGECVLSLEDKGVGMTVEQVFKFVPIPGSSSKRHVKDGKFIGGRGVGLFTAYHGAKRLLIKTSTGDGHTHYFVFMPKYITLNNGELKIVDLEIHWQTVAELYQGTIIQRVSLTEHVELEAAKYHRVIHTHARFVDSNAFQITINDVLVNKPMLPLVSCEIPDFGTVNFLKSNECAFTGGGLYIKSISHELFTDLPDSIKNLLFKHGLVIDFPKNVALNRERNDFESVENFNAFIKPYIIQNCYAAYISLFSQGLATLEELPYDFFNLFRVQMSDIIQRNPNVERDAQIINCGGILNDYTLYQDPQRLTDLLSLLNFIPYQAIKRYDKTIKVSLMTLAKLHHEGKLNPEELKLPPQVQQQIKFDNDYKAIASNFNQVLNREPQLIKTQWVSTHFNGAPNWEFFIQLSHAIVQSLLSQKLVIGFSTLHASALAYTYRGHNQVFWNPINLEKEMPFHDLLASPQAQPLTLGRFKAVLKLITDTLAHECVHLSEAPCSGSHNRSFEIKQRNYLLSGLMKINSQLLYESYLCFYDQHMKNKSNPNAVAFMQLQLNCPIYKSPLATGHASACTAHLDTFGIFSISNANSNNQLHTTHMAHLSVNIFGKA